MTGLNLERIRYVYQSVTVYQSVASPSLECHRNLRTEHYTFATTVHWHATVRIDVTLYKQTSVHKKGYPLRKMKMRNCIM